MFEIENLSVKLKSKNILNKLNLEIKKGNIFGILGRNGAGKTTFFETIYQNTKSTGNILIDNQPISKKQISYCESENYFYPYLSVIDILTLFVNKENEKKVLGLVGFFNIPMNAVVETLSLGTKKKLAILCNLLLERDLYLFDEPFNGLDFESVEKFYLLLKEWKEKGKIILISSHVLETLTHCCDQIGNLQNGAFTKIYSTEEYDLIRPKIIQEIEKDWKNYNAF